MDSGNITSLIVDPVDVRAPADRRAVDHKLEALVEPLPVGQQVVQLVCLRAQAVIATLRLVLRMVSRSRGSVEVFRSVRRRCVEVVAGVGPSD